MSNTPDLYKQLMKRIRDRAKKLMEREDYVDDGQAGRPEWMAPDVWEGLCRDHWSSESWRKASSTNRSNRLKTKDGDITRHTGGSVSVEIHEGRLVSFNNMVFYIAYCVIQAPYVCYLLISGEGARPDADFL